MKLRYNILLSALISLAAGCSDDIMKVDVAEEPYDVDPDAVEAYLSLSVNRMTVSNGNSRAEGDDTADERLAAAENRIDDIWVFQFDANQEDGQHRELIRPIYYRISDQEQLKNLKVLLKENRASYICVVANTKNPDWAKGSGFDTYEGLKNQNLTRTNSFYILPSDLIKENPQDRRSIPMEGENVGVSNDVDNEPTGITVIPKSTVTVNVTRMFAKLTVSFGEVFEGMSKTSITVNEIPNYCRIKSLGDGLEEATPATGYPDGDIWISKGFDPNKEDVILYLPENLQGETNNINPDNKEAETVPARALKVDVKMSYNGEEKPYTVYPGGDNYKNFNIKRNNIYNVVININTPSTQTYNPSSNCFVVIPGEELIFEPYYRIETGGQYGDDADVFKFSTYLNPAQKKEMVNGEEIMVYEYPEKTIDYVEIIWQTKDAIGDNTKDSEDIQKNDNLPLVRFEENVSLPLHSKIHVKTKKEGNALIGAYHTDKNEDGSIKQRTLLWSWHIWVTDIDPANTYSAVTYTTYDWDGNEKKIFSYAQGLKDNQVYERVSGYGVMPCNLGALAKEPASDKTEDVIKTHGMLYQWGRKDPFPPANWVSLQSLNYDYNDTYAGIHYGNDNKTKIGKTSGLQNNNIKSFHTEMGKNLDNPIEFSIRNPMVFISGINADSPPISVSTYFFNKGDWMKVHNQKLWGGLEITPTMEKLEIPGVSGKYMFRNYGTEKTIFDPCPKGWRVPPGDLWLGFTTTGGNPPTYNDINMDVEATNQTPYGMYLYMRESSWNNPGHDKSKLYFPCQGLRLSGGSIRHAGRCGNYHNATSDDQNNVNVLHVHKSTAFHIYEYTYPEFNNKSVGGPIRCVRDRK